MEDLYTSQIELYQAIEKLATNFKKDGADRKTTDYFRRRLSTLEAYWNDFHHNHDRICTEFSREHQYFKNKEYDQTFEYYKKVKNLINKEFQELLGQQTSKTVTPSTSKIEEEDITRKGSRTVSDMITEIASSKHTRTGFNQQDHNSIEDERIQLTASRGVTSQLDDMLRKQSACFRALTRTIENINSDQLDTKWKIDEAIDILQSRWSVIDKLHIDIDGELKEENIEYQQAFHTHEKIYISLKKELNEKKWSTANKEYLTPQLEIPIFHGDYHQWLSFINLFSDSIHNNTALTKSQKMQFLKCKVKGEPERLIQHLQISNDNYDVAWEILHRRYNNMNIIFNSHLDSILNLPSLQHKSLPQIKKLHDVTMESVNGIKKLGVTSWEPIIAHLLAQKLDAETLSDYNHSINNKKEIPSLEELMNFLENRFTPFENLGRRKQDTCIAKSNQQHSPIATSFTRKPKFNFSNNFNTPRVLTTATNAQPTLYCTYCKIKRHALFNCTKFANLPNNTKLKIVSELQLCKNCLHKHNFSSCISEKTCQICGQKHNTILHEASTNKIYERKLPQNKITTPQTNLIYESPQQSVNTVSHETHQQIASTKARATSSQILLSTAKINLTAADGTIHCFRALVDQGSQISLITEKAAQILKIKRERCQGMIFGVGEKSSNCKGQITLTCASIYNNFTFKSDVLIMKNLIKNLPNETFAKPAWEHIKNIKLADPDFNVSSPVDILFGADIYSRIMMGGILRGENTSEPIAQQTQLGWLLCGSMKTFHCNVVISNIEDIQKFWEIEDIGEHSNMSSEDQHCIKFYNETTIRQPSGKYSVRLPLKEKFEENLGSSKSIAIAQFRNIEIKLNKQPNISNMYRDFMNEYKTLRHMKLASCNQTPIECYLPHHGVHRQQSETTKLRVVFNASSKTSSGKSLNDLMYTGPNLQQDLQSLILRWRQFQFGYTSDIQQMFRNIDLQKQDQSLQKIVWRDSPTESLQFYQLTTVTYGIKAAPFLAMMTLRRLAADEREMFPGSSTIVEQSFYMDDLIHGSHSIEEASKTVLELQALLKSGGFILRKWSSNEPKILKSISSTINTDDPVFTFKCEHTAKTLGLYWSPKQDCFMFQSTFEFSNKNTKRALLSDISKLFDPLGWLAPAITKLKLLFQQVWKSKAKWDDKLSDDIINQWEKCKIDISTNIALITIPRWLQITEKCLVKLHGYCDSSNKAYACVIYAVVNQNASLVVSKTKLIPINKTISIPRLELSGALLLAKLMEKVKQCYTEYEIKVYGWTDSMVVLGWLNGDPDKWKPFVSNRVKQIEKIMPSKCWHYVKSEENPADCASRGISIGKLREHTLWWTGPLWLPVFEGTPEIHKYSTKQELKHKLVNVTQKDDDSIVLQILYNSSNYSRAARVIAWILRFVSNNKTKRPTYLTLSEINKAKILIIKTTQSIEFQDEIRDLKQKKYLNKNSKLLCLNPFLDDLNVLRVGGRLRNAQINDRMKHPIILPHSSRHTDLVIDHAHQLTFHGGPRLTLAFIRQKYWIIGGNRAVKKRLRQCVTCVKNTPQHPHEIMGDLPSARCNPARPFYHTGVDFTGFIMIKSSKGRGIKSTKGYIALFVCMSTKAVHLEVVSDLSTSSFLAALRRMAARRGTPRHIYSDNGTNFVGADRALKKEYQDLVEIFNEQFMNEIAEMEITWHFNAASWPSAGGLWESAICSLKKHTKKVIGEQKFTFEELSTLLAQLETCLNMRPLCPLSEDPDDLNCLTPAHFLTNGPSLDILETEHDLRTRWYLVQKTFQDIWKRWRTEYLTQITSRCKWRKPQGNITIGDLVTINDANLPPGKWAMGKVIELHPGADGFVRVVSLKTKNGIIKRPVVKLSPLPIKTNIVENTEPTTSNHDSSVQQSQHTKRVRKRLGNFITLAMTFLYFMSIVNTSQSAYNISSLKTEQGLYFDKISNMQLIRDNWKVVIYYDMNPYWEGVKAFEHYLKCLDTMCINIKTKTHCESSITQLRHSFSELNYYDQLLLNQHTDTRLSRHRRGLIDGVGYIANSLFGVLDSRFAEQYKKDITLLNKNEQHLANLWRNQTSVVEAEYNLLKRSEQEIDKMRKLINRHSLDIEKAINLQIKEVNYLEQFGEFTLSMITASNMLNYLKDIQEILLNTVTDIYHGKFNFHLISPNQLKHELSIISTQVSKDLSLPIKNIHNDFSNIYQFLHIKTRMLQEYLLFELSIPLTSRDSYEIYNIIPVPIKGSQLHMIKIIPVSELIAINLVKDTYLKISKNDVSSCQHNSDTYFCPLKKPLFHMKPEDNLCDIDPTTGRCRFSTLTCENEWNELSGINKYLFFCCDKCQLRIVCENQMSIEQLNVTGIISIGHGCFLKNDIFTIYAHNNDQSILKTKPMIYHPNFDPINDIINISIPWEYINQTTDSRQALNSIAQDIQKMKERSPEISEINYHDVHHYVLIYIILGAVSIVGAIMAWRGFRRRLAVTSAAPASAAPAPAAPTQQRTTPVPVGEHQRRPTTTLMHQTPLSSNPNIDSERVEIHNDEVKCIFPRMHSRSVSPRPRKINFNIPIK